MSRPMHAAAIRSYTPRAMLALAGMASLASAASAQSTIDWASPVDGDFAVASNWLPMVVPGALDRAMLGGFGPYLVSINAPTPVGEVSLANPDASLLVRPGASLTLGGLTGTGTLFIGDGSSASQAELMVLDGAIIDADIRLGGTRTDRARIRGLGSSHRLGRNAVISAASGESGSIVGPWTSEATIIKEGPGTLNVSGLNIVGGTLRSSDGGLLILGNATIDNATIEVGPDARFVTNQATVVSNSIFDGPFTIRSGQDITFGNGVALTDGLAINEPGSIGEARLFVEEGAELNGPIRLEGSVSGGQIIGLGDFQFLGPDAVITGERGAIVGPWISQATIINDGPGGFSLSGLNIVGGTLHSSNGGRLDIAGTTIAGATIEAGAGGSFRTTRDTNLSDSTIVGDYTIESGQRVTFGRGVVLQGNLTINAPGVAAQTQLYAEDQVTLNGPIRLAGSEGEIFGLGGVHVFGPDTVLTGSNGRLTGPWVSRGTIAMGDATGPIGLLLLSGPSLTLGASSRVEIDVAGTEDDQFDRFEGIGSVSLDGSLEVEFVDGYTPEPDDQLKIISATAVDGAFANISIEPVGVVGPAHVVYTGNSVLVVICAADRDGDGALTLFDFLEYQNQFDAGDPRADLDGDGELTIFDFLAFQNRFDAGCS